MRGGRNSSENGLYCGPCLAFNCARTLICVAAAAAHICVVRSVSMWISGE